MRRRDTTIPKRDQTEDNLLAAIRDIHVRIVALLERADLRQWLTDPPPNDEDRTIEDLRSAERLFYQLRAGRAITVAEAEKEGDRMSEEMS
jgi:putative SOS response-associated peptidase YedK